MNQTFYGCASITTSERGTKLLIQSTWLKEKLFLGRARTIQLKKTMKVYPNGRIDISSLDSNPKYNTPVASITKMSMCQAQAPTILGPLLYF